MIFAFLSQRKNAALGTTIGILCIIASVTFISMRFLRVPQTVFTPMQRAYDQMVRDSVHHPDVQIHLGIAKFISADLATRGASMEERVQDFLGRYGALYGLTSATDTQLQIVREQATAEGETSVLLKQTYKDLPVFGGELLIAFRGDRIYSTIGSLLVTDRVLLIEPTLSSSQAIDRARESMGVKQVTTYADPQLEIYDPAVSDAAQVTIHAPRLAWRVFIATPEQKEIHLDAMDGSLLSVFGTVQRHDGFDDFDFDLEDANGIEATSGNACYRLTDADDAIGDEDGLLTRYHRDRDAVQNWWDWRRSYEFFHNNYGFHSYDNDGEDIESYIHAGGAVIGASASYNPTCDLFQFSNGNTAYDITVHEFTHAIIEQSSGLVYFNQSGALNESFADIMAGVADNNWLIGERRTNGGDPFRDMSNPPRMGDPDTMPPRMVTTDNGGVHTNSGIQNKVAFLIADGGMHNGVQVRGIGRSKLGRLMFDVMRTIPSSAQFIDARNRAIVVAESWARTGVFGFNRQDACSVRNAFFSAQYRGWDDATHQDTDCDGVADTRDTDTDNDGIPNNRDNCPNTRNIDQGDSDRDGQGDACDVDGDNDGINDSIDNCPTVPNPQQDFLPGSRLPAACQDTDRDGILNGLDNCPEQANRDQRDMDRDGQGDVCDGDMDQDGVRNQDDNCPVVANPDRRDADRDGVGDACDNCPQMSSTNFADVDRDGIGNVCDTDRDGDGILNEQDECPDTHICFSTQVNDIGTFQLPLSPQPEPFRLNMDTLFCPTCHFQTTPPSVSTCTGLVLEGASSRDVFWFTDQQGHSAGRFVRAKDGTLIFQQTNSLDHIYSLNILPAPRPASTTSTKIHLRRDDQVCVLGKVQVTTPVVTSTRSSPAVQQPSIKTVPTMPTIPPIPTEKQNMTKEEWEKIILEQEPIKTGQAVTPVKPTSPEPVKESVLPTSPVPTPTKIINDPVVSKPVFSSQLPSVQNILVTPILNVFYGVCAQEPTRLRIEFTAQSTNQLTTISITYQTVLSNGALAHAVRTAQLFSLGNDRYMTEIDTQTFAQNDLEGTDGAIRYQIRLIDEAGLQATPEGKRDVLACIPKK